jgi:hypothetical protein
MTRQTDSGLKEAILTLSKKYKVSWCYPNALCRSLNWAKIHAGEKREVKLHLDSAPSHPTFVVYEYLDDPNSK